MARDHRDRPALDHVGACATAVGLGLFYADAINAGFTAVTASDDTVDQDSSWLDVRRRALVVGMGVTNRAVAGALSCADGHDVDGRR